MKSTADYSYNQFLSQKTKIFFSTMPRQLTLKAIKRLILQYFKYLVVVFN